MMDGCFRQDTRYQHTWVVLLLQPVNLDIIMERLFRDLLQLMIDVEFEKSKLFKNV